MSALVTSYDYIIVGSGIAGLYAALQAREHGTVLVLTKGSIDECNTRYAQGGIAAPVGPGDSPQLHFQDTVQAGAGLVEEEAARTLTEEAAERIADLVHLGVAFDTVGGEVALAREGAHSAARVLHAGGDATGAAIELTLAGVARHSRITVLEHAQATTLLLDAGRVAGVEVMDARTGARSAHQGRFVILATGGCGQLYGRTTNPAVATGDGVALAYRAGAEVRDMEFIQFHPTALRMPGVPTFLISEAVRGEGGILKTPEGRPFMRDYHPKADLAPRDVVARAIVAEMRRAGSDHVLLDVTHLPQEWLAARFPQIFRFCRDHGLNMARQPIPVAPAAHYMMGGVLTTVWGETTLPGLYACGEVASTGVHGANRLASNSLLETVVFAQRAVRRTREDPQRAAPPSAEAHALPQRPPTEARPLDQAALQALMWEHVGIEREEGGLSAACRTLAAWERQTTPARDRAAQELANVVLVGRLVAEGALWRRESRGAHYRTDYPEPCEAWRRHTVLRSDAQPLDA